MPLYRVTVTRTVFSNGIRVESGMSVDVPTRLATNPVFVNGGADVMAAFYRIYGIDVSSIWGSLKSALRADQIG
ncbi:DUF6140 family protein [Capnocytophaga cynodegmi]|uniref:Uncharacterized protein n=1 Tax=Capnocytophaga cynodegmi TaxID=28189 RepID=A0A0B7HJ98_9FLAO|nr:DUF6140 family protein [Capnocytophaga cynodegmi]CEN37623.1 conserved hypothetical protein [Capnocytophaga cynodegmi]